MEIEVGLKAEFMKEELECLWLHIGLIKLKMKEKLVERQFLFFFLFLFLFCISFEFKFRRNILDATFLDSFIAKIRLNSRLTLSQASTQNISPVARIELELIWFITGIRLESDWKWTGKYTGIGPETARIGLKSYGIGLVYDWLYLEIYSLELNWTQLELNWK